MTGISRLLACALFLLLAACSRRGFDAKPAPGFVELKEEGSPYDFRAVAPEGVAVAVRAVSLDEPSDLGFWERAVALRMRELEGYALASSRDVKSADGLPGKELVFGHDEEGKPFLYRVRVFVDGKRLFVVEAGGAKEQMERFASSVDWMLGSVRFR
jgi:hypothetical protein